MENFQKDQIFAGIALVLALGLGYTSFGYPANSAFFPRVLSVVMGGLGLMMLVRLQLKVRRHKAASSHVSSCDTPGFSSETQALRMAAFVFGSIIAYGLLVKTINYEISTVVFLGVLMRVLGFRRPVWLVAVPLLLMVLLYGIFFELLGVPRPDSIWFY